jgi:hypothetical protein
VQNDDFARIRTDMEVEDADGDKVGTVTGIYQQTRVASTASSATAPPGEAYIKVHSGLPILGKTLYVPADAIRDVTLDRVILRVDETDVDAQGWDQRPPWIEE